MLTQETMGKERTDKETVHGDPGSHEQSKKSPLEVKGETHGKNHAFLSKNKQKQKYKIKTKTKNPT